ncbi:MAG: Eco57I restriction-modification methylase domain-containing protein, partial [Alphaproteobacteria bacterium]|nr:Eco57I restriction-modification methylase domain-containing protein [Alphaproteobacteria bacterium]
KLNIREFDPDDEKSSVYYNAIIQNLFFATINTKINEREWAEQTQVDGKQFYSFNQRFKTVWRDNNQQSFFIGGYKKEQAQKIASYFNQSPFLNGGLFAPLDRREPIEDAKTGLYKLKYNGEIEYSKVIYHDGFSRDNKANHRAFVPNCAIIGKSGSNIGLISIFKKYYFTVEENTPIEVDVALDPELLGNVFENLIGLYNPETHDIVQKAKQEAQRNRRKATGSFYTPKEIVQYMTQSSVVQYLVKETGYDFQDIETLVKDDNLPDSFLDKFGELKTDVAETISDAIIKCKILDPACGSGAFPMGCLQILNSILARIDNDNKVWQNTIIKITKEENSKNNTLDFEKFKKEQDRINTAFLYSSKFPGYFRKLYLLEHCIYGVDIQRIAMQITKLRFFIALVAECEATNNIEQNYGMHALPNLETKFVCANTLITSKYAIINKRIAELTQTDGQQIYSNEDDMLQNLKDQLSDIRKNYFYADTKEDKFSFENADYQKQNEIKEYLRNVEKNPIYIECQKVIAEETINIQNNQKEWEKYQEKDWEIKIETDLFGNETQTKIDKNASKREYWARFIRNSETKIADQNHIIYVLKQYPDAVKQLAKWQIYNPNADACDFFDADWMFNISNFDIVIGNPPYIDSEMMTKVMPEMRRVYAQCFKTAKGNWDMFIVFIEKGLNLCTKTGTFCFIIPNKLIASKYAESLRSVLAYESSLIEIRDYSRIPVFANAAVYPCTILGSKILSHNNYMSFINMENIVDISASNTVDYNYFKLFEVWDVFFRPQVEFNVVKKFLSNPLLSESYKVIGAATVSEAYEIKDVLKDKADYRDAFKVVNTGT